MSIGVIYVVSGGRSYLGELMTSLQSLQRFEPDLPVTVFSRFPLPRSARADFQHTDSPEHPLKLKVLTLRKSPYKHTLFLDTDTSVRGPLRPIFENLATHDFCAANSHQADWSVMPPRFVAMVKPRDYNTGVLVYDRDSDATQQFLMCWEQAVLAQDAVDMWAGHNCDQHHFNTLVTAGVLEESGVRFKELENVVYNCRGPMYDAVQKLGRTDDIRIFHHRTRTMKLRKLLYTAKGSMSMRELFKKFTHRLHPV